MGQRENSFFGWGGDHNKKVWKVLFYMSCKFFIKIYGHIYVYVYRTALEVFSRN